MTRRALVLVLFAHGSLFGCAAEPAPAVSCDIDPERVAAVRALGTQTKDVILNGENLNGATMNAATLNGAMDLATPTGIMIANGENLNGKFLNGETLNGIIMNGIVMNRMAGNGVDIAAVGTELVGTTPDGRVLGGDAFVGATVPGVLTSGKTIDLTITSFARTSDPKVVHYTLEHEGKNICGAGGTGMFVPGVWDATGARHDERVVGTHHVRTSYSCTSGVIGKCVTWGYAPWQPGGADAHQACTRLARADYCGNGVSFTKNGTAIDVFDRFGVQSSASRAGDLFEAGWGPNGAVCVARTRFDAKRSDGTRVLPSCFAHLPSCTSWNEALAKGAIAGNASAPAERAYCD